MVDQPIQTGELYIDNSAYARSNLLFGRVMPALVAVWAIWILLSLASSGFTRGMVVPSLLGGLMIVYMIVAYARRGRHPVVKAIEFFPDRLNVDFSNGPSSFDLAQIRTMEFEGTRNRARVGVLNAVFPKYDERILVVTLTDDVELRVRVGLEHDAPLKEVAARLSRP